MKYIDGHFSIAMPKHMSIAAVACTYLITKASIKKRRMMAAAIKDQPSSTSGLLDSGFFNDVIKTATEKIAEDILNVPSKEPEKLADKLDPHPLRTELEHPAYHHEGGKRIEVDAADNVQPIEEFGPVRRDLFTGTVFERDFGYDIELAERMLDDAYKAPEQRAQAREFLTAVKHIQAAADAEREEEAEASTDDES